MFRGLIGLLEIKEIDRYVYLDVILRSPEYVNEVLRRLKSKKNRKSTEVEITRKEEVISKDFSYIKERIRLKNIGYKSKIQIKGYSYFLSISKIIAIGNNLIKGKHLYAYTGEDQNGRSILIVYLDGNPRDETKEIETVEYNTFIEKQSDMLKKANRQLQTSHNSLDSGYDVG